MALPLNLEMGNTPEMVDFALRLKPDYICMVPEKREEITTEGGLDAVFHEKDLAPTMARMADNGIQVSLFIDPEVPQVEAAARLGAAVGETWVFEDAVHAAATAAAAGYPVAGVADPYSDQAELRKLSRIYLPDMTDFSGFYQRATR